MYSTFCITFCLRNDNSSVLSINVFNVLKSENTQLNLQNSILMTIDSAAALQYTCMNINFYVQILPSRFKEYD